jgi:hypothetical protein
VNRQPQLGTSTFAAKTCLHTCSSTSHHTSGPSTLAPINMAGPAGPRRSGRARKPVITYADETTTENTGAVQPPTKRKRATPKPKTPSTEDEEADFQTCDPKQESEAEASEVEAPKKRAKAVKKRKNQNFEIDEEGVRRLVSTKPRPPGERRTPQVITSMCVYSCSDRWHDAGLGSCCQSRRSQGTVSQC